MQPGCWNRFETTSGSEMRNDEKGEVAKKGGPVKSKLTFPPNTEVEVVICLKRPLKLQEESRNCRNDAIKSQNRQRFWLYQRNEGRLLSYKNV